MEGWTAADILRLVGWACIFTAFVLVFPTVGIGGGASHEPGSDMIRTMAFDRGYGVAALVMAVTGALVLVAAKLVATRR